MVLLTANRVFACVLEATYRTAPAIADTDAIRLTDIQFDPNDSVRRRERAGVKPTFGMAKSIHGGSLARLTGTLEIRGSGAAGTPPKAGRILQACGWSEAIVASTSVTYQQSSDVNGHRSLSYYYWEDGVRHLVSGVRGAVQSLQWTPEALLAQIELVGHEDTDAVDNNPTIDPADFDAQLPLPVLGATMAIGGLTPVVDQFTFNPQTTIQRSVDINQVNGFGQVRLVDGNAIIEISPEKELVAVQDWQKEMIAGTEYAFDTGAIGSAGAQVRFQAPKVYAMTHAAEDREGSEVDSLTLHCQETGGDDAWSLVFT